MSAKVLTPSSPDKPAAHPGRVGYLDQVRLMLEITPDAAMPYPGYVLRESGFVAARLGGRSGDAGFG